MNNKIRKEKEERTCHLYRMKKRMKKRIRTKNQTYLRRKEKKGQQVYEEQDRS